jgi:cytochrome c oxidase cbb3-type subunit 1
MEKKTYDDTPVKLMVYPSIIFLVITMTVGVFIAFNGFVFPDYFQGEYVHFGKLRPVHVNGVALTWLLSVDIGMALFIVPRLCGISIWNVRFANVTAILWWITLTLGVFSFPGGTNFGWEYDELPMWVGFIPVKLMFTGLFVCWTINIFMTIAKRKYKKMYVSLWYVMGALVWTIFNALVGMIGIMAMPEGISRVNASFFFVHNLVGLTFTPFGVAAAYYFIPKIANTPLYSHKLSMIGFWSIAFVYAWIGAHHMIHGPISQWLQTVSIVFSIWLFIPVWTVIVNFFATMRGKWNEYNQSPPIRFLMVGTLYYLLTCIQGPLQALRNVNEITSKTDWIIGHAHMALFGSFTFFALAGVYHIVEVVTKKPIWSKSLGDWHFTLNLIGSLFFFGALFIGGFNQGLEWASWATGSSYAQFHQNLSALPFLETVAGMYPWWVMRGLGGIMILIGNILFAINMFNTIVLKPQPTENV